MRNYSYMGETNNNVRSKDYAQKETDVKVVSGLSLTPKQMYQMAERGIPISAQAGAAIEGEMRPTWDVPLDKMKRIDVAELWEKKQEIAQKVRVAQRKKHLEETTKKD